MQLIQFSRRVRRLLPTTLLLLWLTPTAWSLQAEHEAERLLMAADEAFSNSQYNQAADYLSSVRRLGIVPPPEYNYYYGKLLLHDKRYAEARNHLENYVNSQGSAALHYREALGLITDIEKQRNGRPSSSSGANRGKAEIKWSNNDNEKYISHLEDIYAVDDPISALTKHINSLLQFYAYGDDRIIAASRFGTPSRHRIYTSSRGEIVSMNKIGAADNIPFTEDRFSVYGVNFQVAYRCQRASSSCWLLHPVTSERWLQIVYNTEAATELSKAVSQLIRQMQQSG